MLKKENFTEGHIRELQKRSRRDPGLLERTVYAFGLLEAITKVGMPFIFKGGSCLMLLLDEPRRLSTDIDIIVAPGTPVEEYIKKASVIFPFEKVEEQKRVGKNKIEKRHFKFTYDSPINGKPFYILLDILFENNYYARLVKRPIRHNLLLTEPDYLEVTLPDADCILGDKLTAFAPHTTGIPLGIEKDMEIMKQFYDICSLLEVFHDFAEVRNTYSKIAVSEIAYRGDEITSDDALMDTFKTAMCIAGRGKILPQEYPLYVAGIHDLRGHIYSENYSAEIAAGRAVRIMYMAACIMTETEYMKAEGYEEYADKKVSNPALLPLKYLRRADPMAYAYLIKTDELLENMEIIL